MSATPNERRSNNTSGVPCLRLRTRQTRTGLTRKWIDVTWLKGKRNPKRGGTSFPADRAPMKAVERAMRRREQEAGVLYDISPQAAWALLKRSQGATS